MVFSAGTCPCGAVSVAIDLKPFFTYNCHCSNCRAYASRFQPEPLPFNGGAVVWKWNVTLYGTENIEYESSAAVGGLFAMSRGRCSKCHQPVWESGSRVLFPFAMVSTTPVLKLKPNTDIFYDLGLKGTSTCPTVNTVGYRITFLRDLFDLVLRHPTAALVILQALDSGQGPFPGDR